MSIHDENRSPVLSKAEGIVNSEFKNEQWYALQVRPRFEKIVTAHLQHKGYGEYLPLYKSRRRWSDRIKELELPLFSGYTFCRFDIHNRLPILMVPGVLSIVGAGKHPTPVSDEEILAIQDIAQSGLEYGPWPFIKAGQPVSVERGPLAGLEGVVVEIKAGWRLIVSLPLLQRSVAVEIDRDCVQPISSSSIQKTPSSFDRVFAHIGN
jgi:transcription antitermination factor NusG